MDEILKLAYSKIKSNLDCIKELLDSDENISSYKVHSIDDELILISGTSKKSKLSIGFPFPLITKELDLMTKVSGHLYLRGEPIRNYQRKMLHNHVDCVKEINSLAEFRNICAQHLKNQEYATYWDPYSFTGDSFIGLYFLKIISEHWKLNVERIVSSAHLHLKSFFNTKSWLYATPVRGVQIFADLLDIHWQNTLPTLANSAKKGLTSIVVGRNIIIGSNKNKSTFYWYNSSDHLLRNENIEDYMNECLTPFCDSNSLKQKSFSLKGRNLIINPFGSELLKTIPVKIVSDFLKYYIADHPDADVSIMEGFRNSGHHINWISELRGHLHDLKISQFNFVNFGNLNEMVEYIFNKDISFGISADTSIPHILNYIDIPNLTIYNLARCDTENIQSLSSHSPLGFCRYKPTQLPVLLHSENENTLGTVMYKFVQDILAKEPPSCVLDFKRKVENNIDEIIKNNSDLLQEYSNLSKKLGSWIYSIYDPGKLLPFKLTEEHKKLARTSWKINPFYKRGIKND